MKSLIIENPFEDVVIPERMTWTASSVKQFRNCKRKWFWKYILRLRSRARPVALMIGAAFHEALGEWYKTKRSSMRSIAAKHVKALEEEAMENKPMYGQEDYDKLEAAIETLKGMLCGYADCYGDDRKKWHIERDHIEMEFCIDMGEFDFAGKVDLIASEKKGKKESFIVEHKTASTIPDSYIGRLMLDTQVRGYIFGAVYGLNIAAKRVVYDVVRKTRVRRKTNESSDAYCERIANEYMSRPSHYFYREKLRFSKDDIARFETELRQTHQEYVYLVRDLKDAPIIEARQPEHWTPNDSQCTQFFRMCSFHKLCTAGLDAGTGHMFEQGDNFHEELAAEWE